MNILITEFFLGWSLKRTEQRGDKHEINNLWEQFYDQKEWFRVFEGKYIRENTEINNKK